MFKKVTSLFFLLLFFGIVAITIPQPSFAIDAGIDAVDGSIKLSGKNPINIATNIINIFLGLLSLIAVSFVLWGGFIWMTSNGSEEKISQAKKILRNGAIGLVIILSAWGITYFILTKIMGSTGESSGAADNCTNGAVVSCGCGGQQTCNNGSWGPCLGSFCQPDIEPTSCDGKSAVDKCQPDAGLCGPDYFCDENSCLCQPKASLGESCNANSDGKCSADDNLCGPYLKCDPNDCVCVGPPVITGVSPAGAFCANDKNRACNTDADCLNGAKCDVITPNGASNNFLTIYGYNFGSATNLFENTLTNVDFEKGEEGGIPDDWTAANQKNSRVGISTEEARSGAKSILIHQDPNHNYPGTCNKSTCQNLTDCSWNETNKTCSFAIGDDGHKDPPAVYNNGESLIWGNTNRVMWAKLTYNLAPLNFQVGDTYSIQFYYKGKTSANISVAIGYNLGWTSQCVGYGSYGALKTGYTWNGSSVSPEPAEGDDPCAPAYGKTCANQENTCCLNAPYQSKCYQSVNISAIPAGVFDDWTLYSYNFQYTPEMDSWLNSVGKKMMEVGLSIGYNSTLDGTDFYVDDFSVTKVLDTGQVAFLGEEAGQSQLANFPKLLNPNCISYWTDRQITIAVPSGAATGPIQVKREGDSENNTDTTDDDIGPLIPDFVKNDIIRPSLCQISPSQGLLGDKVEYQGVNLKNSVAYFGEYSDAYRGINSVFTADNLSGQTIAPNIIPGKTTTFVERNSLGSNQKSNALIFIKEKEAESGPYISSFYPKTGTVGQYVTILGSGFGNLRGSRQVFFGDKEASYSFPEVCSNSVWSDNQIVVKVPDGLSAGDYVIKINLGDKFINTDLLAPNHKFNYNPGETLKTSLCKIDPVKGGIGDKVSLWGEYFGDINTEALIVFNRGVNITSKITKDGLADKIETTVPVDSSKTPAISAITGPVKVMKNGKWGNELNFTVGKCSANSECGASSPVCCPGNTYKSGSCSASLLSCYFEVPNSVYETKFNTTIKSVEKFDSCIEMATFYNGCQTGQFCPNSPGKCSPFNPLGSLEVLDDCGAANSECGDIAACLVTDANTPRIMYWPGKVNQHWDLESASWATDPDGVSGSEVNMLSYCRKFYPETDSVISYKTETINTWRDQKNEGSHTGTQTSYRCVLKGETASSKCFYNKTKDVCQNNACILSKDLDYSLAGQDFKGTLSCRAYEDKVTKRSYFIKHLKVSTSCPQGWLGVGGGYCVDAALTECDPCADGLSCVDDNNGDDFGICESSKICDSTSYCGLNPKDSSKFSCLRTQDKSCDCCCEIGQDTRDCCAPLKCAGTCGSDITDDGKGYGSCSGCADVPGTQDMKDAACNCATTSGKYCDISKPGGICVDCAALDENSCSLHSTQCCFDEVKGVCQGGDGTKLAGGKCAYYDCDVANKECNITPSTSGRFTSVTSCSDSCKDNPMTVCDLPENQTPQQCSSFTQCCFDDKNKKCLNSSDSLSISGVRYCAYYDCDTSSLGGALSYKCSAAKISGNYLSLNSCIDACGNGNTSLPGATCKSDLEDVCDTSQCSGDYSCLNESGSSPSSEGCGTCCCDPKSENACSNTENLKCTPNMGACGGDNRGLCCGCSADSQCGSDSAGCGTDTCCHGRPQLTQTLPVNGQTNVCRNSQIVIKFNERMDNLSFNENILLIEEKEYGKDLCENGTAVSLENYNLNNNFFAKIYRRALLAFNKVFNKESYQALAAKPSNDKLYCLVPGTIETKIEYSPSGATSTAVYVQPKNIFSKNANYFVVVKGDENMDSNSGVMSLNKIGFNGSVARPLGDTNVIIGAEFNKISFKNSYVFGFRTMDDKSGKNGLCSISRVQVAPSSFLINSIDNNPQDDNPLTDEFDSIDDNDRLLTATAYSSDDQILQPVSGYYWNWLWDIDDTSVVEEVSGYKLKDNQFLVKSVSGATDKSTKISAQVSMKNFKTSSGCSSNNCVCDGNDCSNKCCNATFDSENIEAESSAYVFLCANPWPSPKNGTWSPWYDVGTCRDSNQNIIPCANYNYKFYYCRDAGEPGTSDDLPVVSNPALILGPSSNLICSTDGSPCFNQGSTCGQNGTCVWSVLKESYFFREAAPKAGKINEILSTGLGGEVRLSWSAPISSDTPITSFKIYYGQNSSGATSVKTLNLLEAKCSLGGSEHLCSYKIDKLENEKKYYFRVSALTDKKTESPLSGSLEVIPTDTTAPVKPAGLKLSASDDKIIVSWDHNKDDALYYRLFHGFFSSKISDSIDSAEKSNRIILNQSDYRAGGHYFSLSAVDSYGNISEKSNELKINIPNTPINVNALDVGNYLTVSWGKNNNDSSVRYSVFISTDGYNYEKVSTPSQEVPNQSTYNIDSSKYNKGLNYIVVQAYNSGNFRSVKSAPVEVVIK